MLQDPANRELRLPSLRNMDDEDWQMAKNYVQASRENWTSGHKAERAQEDTFTSARLQRQIHDHAAQVSLTSQPVIASHGKSLTLLEAIIAFQNANPLGQLMLACQLVKACWLA